MSALFRMAVVALLTMIATAVLAETGHPWWPAAVVGMVYAFADMCDMDKRRRRRRYVDPKSWGYDRSDA